ncbi:hypothetical protein DWY99_00445 [[Clostridium] leptum]|uniref:Uncharacterized protein n=1 Tax=[Clostridium] leptum TaxID=1535 RepID=A0A412B1M2_9FIRM|nr:hypothetical protein DWY99_00445 [[Clostridium] leptum]
MCDNLGGAAGAAVGANSEVRFIRRPMTLAASAEGPPLEQTTPKAFGPLSAGKSWKTKPAGKTY